MSLHNFLSKNIISFQDKAMTSYLKMASEFFESPKVGLGHYFVGQNPGTM